MLGSVRRCLLYRRTLSEHFTRNHWSSPSSSKTDSAPASTETQSYTDEPRNSDFAAQFASLLPSKQLMNLMSDSEKRRLDVLIKQVELYCYMAKKVPSHISDNSWRELLSIRSVVERVSKLEFYAVKERREMRDKTASKEEEHEEYLRLQRAEFDAGGMGYGPNMYQVITNPMRRQQRIHQVEGARTWATLRVREAPTVVFDMQYIFDGKHRGEFNIKRQLQYVITENLQASRPLPLVFSNVVDNAHGKGYMENSLGYWSGQYLHQTILPDYYATPPKDALVRSMAATTKKDPKIVYISRYAKKVLDGPLKADAYVMCASYDQQRESIIAAHRDKIEAYRLPIHRYVRWQRGPQYIPFPNMMRIIREVTDSGGDWKTALLNNISKRHLEPVDDDIAAIRTSMRRERERERAEIVGAIIDAYGEP